MVFVDLERDAEAAVVRGDPQHPAQGGRGVRAGLDGEQEVALTAGEQEIELGGAKAEGEGAAQGADGALVELGGARFGGRGLARRRRGGGAAEQPEGVAEGQRGGSRIVAVDPRADEVLAVAIPRGGQLGDVLSVPRRQVRGARRGVGASGRGRRDEGDLGEEAVELGEAGAVVRAVEGGGGELSVCADQGGEAAAKVALGGGRGAGWEGG